MIDGSEKRNRQLAFELQNSHVCEKRSNDVSDAYHGIWSKEQDSIGQPRGRLIEDLYGILI